MSGVQAYSLDGTLADGAPPAIRLSPVGLTSLGIDAEGQHKLYLRALGGQILNPPLVVEVERGEEGSLAFSPLLRVGGSGPSPADAIADLAETIWAMWQEFTEECSPDDLHASAVEFVAQLRNILHR